MYFFNLRKVAEKFQCDPHVKLYRERNSSTNPANNNLLDLVFCTRAAMSRNETFDIECCFVLHTFEIKNKCSI